VMHGFENLVLLARVSRFRAMGSGLRGRRARVDTGDVLTIAFVFVILILGAVILSRFVASREDGRSFSSPGALFRALMKAHGIDRPGRRLFRRLARWHRLSQPGQLFVDLARFDLASLSPKLQKDGPAITALRNRLFAQLKQAASGGSPQRKLSATAAPTSLPPTGLSVDAANPIAIPDMTAGTG